MVTNNLKNTVSVQREHIDWSGDATTIQFAHSKTDREGQDAGNKRHVYANPFMPAICPVLSIAQYFAANPDKESGRLFSGGKQYDRFRKLLGRIVEKHSKEIRRMDIDPKDLGVHSIRKGAAAYCCNGTTSGVSFASVCNCAGWSMGGIKDHYLQYDSAGDQVCGRTVTGLEVTSYRYSVSQPHFKNVRSSTTNSTSATPNKSTCTEEEDIDAAIETTFGEIPERWQMLARYFLASLLFHSEYLDKTMHKSSLVRGSSVFRREVFDCVRDCVLTCFPWD